MYLFLDIMMNNKCFTLLLSESTLKPKFHIQSSQCHFKVEIVFFQIVYSQILYHQNKIIIFNRILMNIILFI